ncbi:MAG: hypothetical protein U9O94_05045 [Nanoarchaeota archaeon]|nr:hypothetical protein [Nanoarchaeota archaeon]
MLVGDEEKKRLEELLDYENFRPTHVTTPLRNLIYLGLGRYGYNSTSIALSLKEKKDIIEDFEPVLEERKETIEDLGPILQQRTDFLGIIENILEKYPSFLRESKASWDTLRTLEDLTINELRKIKRKLKSEGISNKYGQIRDLLKNKKNVHERMDFTDSLREILSEYNVIDTDYLGFIDKLHETERYAKKMIRINKKLEDEGIYERFDLIMNKPKGRRNKNNIKNLKEAAAKIFENHGLEGKNITRMIQYVRRKNKQLTEQKTKNNYNGPNNLHPKQIIQRDEASKLYLGVLKAAIYILKGEKQKADYVLSKVEDLNPDYISDIKKKGVNLPKLIRELQVKEKNNYKQKKLLLVSEEEIEEEIRRPLEFSLKGLSEVTTNLLTRTKNIFRSKKAYQSMLQDNANKLIAYSLGGLISNITEMENKSDVEDRRQKELRRLYKDYKLKGTSYQILRLRYGFISKDNLLETLKNYEERMYELLKKRSVKELMNIERDVTNKVETMKIMSKYRFNNAEDMFAGLEFYKILRKRVDEFMGISLSKVYNAVK